MEETIVVIKVWDVGNQTYFMDYADPLGNIVRGAKATILWHGSSWGHIPWCRNLKPYSFCTFHSINDRSDNMAFYRAVANEYHSHEVHLVDDVNKSNSPDETTRMINEHNNKNKWV